MPEPKSPDDLAAHLRTLEKDELVRMLMDDAKNWLAHDGLWFQAVEAEHGMEAAISADAAAWKLFTVIEAKRILERLGLAPKRKGLPDFPCKSVGVVEYGEFAKAIDPRIRTRCVACPPDAHPADAWCTWEFSIEPGGARP